MPEVFQSMLVFPSFRLFVSIFLQLTKCKGFVVVNTVVLCRFFFSFLQIKVLSLLSLILYAVFDLLSSCLIASMSSSFSLVNSFLISSKMSCFSLSESSPSIWTPLALGCDKGTDFGLCNES